MYWEDWRNVLFLIVAVMLMFGLVLFARGDFKPFLEENRFTTKPVTPPPADPPATQ